MAYNLSKLFSTHMHQLLIYYKYRKNTYQSVQNLYFIHYFATKISITFLAIKQPEVYYNDYGTYLVTSVCRRHSLTRLLHPVMLLTVAPRKTFRAAIDDRGMQTFGSRHSMIHSPTSYSLHITSSVIQTHPRFNCLFLRIPSS